MTQTCNCFQRMTKTQRQQLTWRSQQSQWHQSHYKDCIVTVSSVLFQVLVCLRCCFLIIRRHTLFLAATLVLLVLDATVSIIIIFNVTKWKHSFHTVRAVNVSSRATGGFVSKVLRLVWDSWSTKYRMITWGTCRFYRLYKHMLYEWSLTAWYTSVMYINRH